MRMASALSSLLGTSPPAWGNPTQGAIRAMQYGHIPTRVGEPIIQPALSDRKGAHPHPRGGTAL